MLRRRGFVIFHPSNNSVVLEAHTYRVGSRMEINKGKFKDLAGRLEELEEVGRVLLEENRAG